MYKIIRMVFFIIFIYTMKKMTKTELIVELKKKGIKGYSKLKRDEMEELLNKGTSAINFSHIKDVDVLTSGMGKMKIADKGMAELQARARVCAEGKNPNLALGQQTIECAPKRVFYEYAARPKQRQAMTASTPVETDKYKYMKAPPPPPMSIEREMDVYKMQRDVLGRRSTAQEIAEEIARQKKAKRDEVNARARWMRQQKKLHPNPYAGII